MYLRLIIENIKSLGHTAILIAGLALMLCAAQVGADEVADAQKQLKQVQQRIGSLQSKIERDQRRRGDLSQALAGAERQIGDLAARLHDSKKAIAGREQKITTLDKQRNQQQQALQRKLGDLTGQVRAAYKTGQQGKLRLLFSQNDPASLGRLLKYHDYYASAQSQAIANVRGELDALRSTRTAITSQRDALQTQREKQARLLSGLRDSQQEREQALATVDQALDGGKHKLETLKADESQLRELMDNVRNQLADIPVQTEGKPFSKVKGQLQPPVSGRTIAAFGQKKSGGPLVWQGVWLSAKIGAPVTTAAAGRVVYVGHMHRYGLIVVIDHGDDFYTVYGHTQAAYVEVGQWVRAGETIASAGNSGGHKTSGVYFEIRQGRTPVNPASWLRS